jgi:hypothetical protein
MPHIARSLPESAHLLLEQELQCFHEIMSRTQEIIEDADTMSLKSILELLDVREYWIERLKQLEYKKSLLSIPDSELKKSEQVQKISAIAKSLVVTDAKLLDILQVRKMNSVKEMGKIADNRGEATNAMKNVQQPTILDTRSI